MIRPTDVRIAEVVPSYEDYLYRTPIKFGGVALDRVTLLNVHVRVQGRNGAEAAGFGSMPLGNVWSFPSRAMRYEQTLAAMKALAEEIARLTRDGAGFGHPIELNQSLEPLYWEAAAEVSRRLDLPEPIPKLAMLVTASPFDAAVHDAWGKLHGIGCYRGYGPEYLEHDVAHYLGCGFAGMRLDQVVTADPKAKLPLYHLVGALDPIAESDIRQRIADGLPETLPEWIAAEGLTHLKIKLNGNDLGWDVARVIAVDRAAAESIERVYSLDFNERCPNVEYLLDFLCRLKRDSPGLFERIQYIEQPTARDLTASRNDMHEAARLKPVIIDESLVDYESLLLARELGYSGVALKACKGQSNALLMAAAAKKFGMFLCVQDLTCPGASLIHSAGLAAHIPEVAAIEANSRQYVPAANREWVERFPGIFRIRNGVMDTSGLTGVGLDWEQCRKKMRMNGRFCVLMLMVGSLSAQEFRAGLAGIVRDAQGAVMPQVSIEAVSLKTNETFRATTNASGYYALQALPIGTYHLSASATGFKKAVRDGLELRVGEQVQQDFLLEIGAVSEQVTITAEAELLQTSPVDKGEVISEENVRDLPSVGRNPFLLGVTAPGVQFDTGLGQLSRAVRPFDDGSNVGESMTVNGGRPSSSDLLLDGMPNTGTESTNAANTGFVPTPDATAEFRIQTSNYDAQYGRTSGGTISVSIKAGGNKFHGLVYEYLRNDVLTANTFDSNRLGIARPLFKWNQPGFELDGPVVIPHVYDGRNRTFFMYSFEMIRDKLPFPQTQAVPLPEAVQGNFNTTLQSNGQPVVIYDPMTTVQTGTNTYTRQPFPGNIIPTNRFNPVGAKIASFIPAPNQLGQTNNFIAAPNPRSDKYNAHVFRLDQTVNDKHRFFSRFVRGARTEQNSTNGWPKAAAPQYNGWRGNNAGNFDLTSLLAPNTVLTSRVGYFRHNYGHATFASGYDPTQLGFPSSLLRDLPPFFPTITMTNYNSFGMPSSGDIYSYSSSWSWSEVMNKVINRHSVKFGGEMRVIQNNINSPATNFGSYAFTPTFTQANPLAASAANGNAMASLLLGQPTSGSAPINAAPAWGYRYYGVFIHDDWRISSAITLSAGLRWDYESPVTERNNQENAGFDANAASPLQIPGMNLKGGLLFTGKGQHIPYQRDLNNFQPRVGLAWRPAAKTVVRAGYGLSHLATFTPAFNQGFSTATPYVATDGGVFLNNNTLSNPYPDGILRPTGSSLGLATFLGQTISFANQQRVVPYVHQFSIGVQRELGWRTVVEATYVGSRSAALDVSQQIDDVSMAQLLQYGASLTGSQPNPFINKLPGTNLNAATTTLQQLLRPFPQFTGITEANIPMGKSWYNSLQLRIDKRMSKGLNLRAAYTHARWLEAVQYLNNQDPIAQTPQRTLAATDTPHRLTLSGNWDLPLFRRTHGVAGIFLKGWQANGVYVVQTGFPLATPAGYYSSGIDPSLANPTLARYFNTCTQTVSGTRTNCASASEPVAFIQQPTMTLRTLSLRFPSIRPPRVPSVDVSMFKSFTLREGLRLQFRAEAFNAINGAQFGNPSTSLGSNTAGIYTLTQVNDSRNLQLALKLVW